MAEGGDEGAPRSLAEELKGVGVWDCPILCKKKRKGWATHVLRWWERWATRHPRSVLAEKMGHPPKSQTKWSRTMKSSSILKIGIRKLERDTSVSHHTLEKILKGESARRKTLAKIVRQVQSMNNNDRLDSGALT